MTLPLLAGCLNPAGGMSAREQAQLEHRALDLLFRATQSEQDIVRANAIEALVNVAPQAALGYFRAAVDDQSELVRFNGCIAAGEVRDQAAQEAIRRRLSDPAPRVRLAAAAAACRLGDTNAARTLVSTLNDHPDEFLRADAAFLIGKVGEPAAIARLQWAARREKSTKVLVHIYAALARLEERTAIHRLINYAQGDTASRIVALQSMCELNDERASDALLYRLNDARDYLVPRLIAARALGRLGSNAGYKLAAESLHHAAADLNETMSVRVNAALALGAIGDRRALPLLKSLAEAENDPRTQVAACYAICQITARRRE